MPTTDPARYDASEVVRAALMTPTSYGWGLPLLLEGEPGTAKTSIVERIAHTLGLVCQTLVASLRQPADFLGYPTPSARIPGIVDMLVERWVMELAEGPGLLFLDELNTAPPATQAAVLRVALEKIIGDTKLDRGVRIIAAQNATGDAAGGWDLAPPLANRFGHLPWSGPPLAAWSEHILDGDLAPDQAPAPAVSLDDAEDAVMAAWPSPWATARGAAVAFLHTRPDLLHKLPAQGSDARGYAWPSRRTWSLAMRAMASAEVHGLSMTERDTLVGAYIGNGAAVELSAWLSRQDLPRPEDVLSGAATFAHNPERLDRTHAVLSAVAAYTVALTDQNARVDAARAAWGVLDSVCTAGAADLAWAPAETMARVKLTGLDEARPVLRAVFPLTGMVA